MLTCDAPPMTTISNRDRTMWPPPSSAPRLGPDVVAGRSAAPAVINEQTRNASASSPLVLLPLRIFLAAGWLRAAAEKLISSDWWNGTELRTFVVEQHQTALPFFRPIMEHAIPPAAAGVGVAVMLAEIACGLALATGRFMRAALYIGAVMNVAFVFAGRVNPSAFYLVMEIALLFAIADGTIGISPTRATSRTRTAAFAWFALALVFVPYIRTMEPADVIADPAIMCLFLAVITGAGLLYRWASALPATPTSKVVSALVDRADAWAHAKHARVGRARRG